MDRHNYVSRCTAVATIALVSVVAAHSQSTGSATQTVNQRNTIGVMTASPSSGVTAGQSVTFSYVLHTGGAPAPTSETIQFYDNGSAIGSASAIAASSATNLLPYAQINTSNNWTTLGSPTVQAAHDAGADGSSASAANVALPSSASVNQGVSYAVSGTSYASQTMTLSVWAKTTAGTTTLTLGLTDNPALHAAGSGTCALTTAWQRCTLTYAFPSNANSGFIVNLYATGQSASTVDLWGAQVEQASTAGPFVWTIGTALTSGEQGGTSTFSYSGMLNGAHSITAVYAGDSNFITSTSNALGFAVTQATPTVTLTASKASPQTYGTSITFTLAATSAAGVPTGTIQLMDGATVLGTATLSGGSATITLSGTSALAGGTHTLQASYAGDTNNLAALSATLPYTINKAASSVAITTVSSENPSIYGDKVTFNFTVATTIGGVTPTGTVTVVDGLTSTTIGTFTLNGSGVATTTVPLFTAGSHNLTITYSGDTNYQ